MKIFNREEEEETEKNVGFLRILFYGLFVLIEEEEEEQKEERNYFYSTRGEKERAR